MAWSLTPPFTHGQQVFLAICPKITSVPSIVASLYLLQHLLKSPKRRRRVYSRIMLGMSCMDFVYSIKTFVSTWPLPAGTAYGATGTTQTCTAAGFFGQGASLSSVLYNGTLTLYFVLTIKFGWTHTQFMQYKWSVEILVLHGIPLAIGWGTAIASLPLLLMNPIGWTCWIGPWPLTCPANPDTCIRGANAKTYRWAFFHAILWATFAFVAVSMILIYSKIRAHERKSLRYTVHGGRAEQQQQHASRTVHRTSSGSPKQQQNGGSMWFLPSYLSQRPAESQSQTQAKEQEPTRAQLSSIPSSPPQPEEGATADGRNRTSDFDHGDPAAGTRPLESNSSGLDKSSTTTIMAPENNTIHDSSSSRHRRAQQRELLSQRFAMQALCYVLAFFLAWIFPMAQFAVSNSPSGTLYYPLLAVTVVINPLQGFFNTLIYFRPRYLRYRQKQQQNQRPRRKRRRRILWRRSRSDNNDNCGDQPSTPPPSSTVSNHHIPLWKAFIMAVSEDADDLDDLEFEEEEEEDSNKD